MHTRLLRFAERHPSSVCVCVSSVWLHCWSTVCQIRGEWLEISIDVRISTSMKTTVINHAPRCSKKPNPVTKSQIYVIITHKHVQTHIWLHSCRLQQTTTTSSSSSAGVAVVVVFGGAAHVVVSERNTRPDERRKVCTAECWFECTQRTFTFIEQYTHTDTHTHISPRLQVVHAYKSSFYCII